MMGCALKPWAKMNSLVALVSSFVIAVKGSNSDMFVCQERRTEKEGEIDGKNYVNCKIIGLTLEILTVMLTV